MDTSTPLWRAFAALSSGFPCDWPEPLRHRGGVAGDDRQVNRESLRHRGDERMHVVEDILRRGEALAGTDALTLRLVLPPSGG